MLKATETKKGSLRKAPLSRFSKLVLSLVAADVLLLLVLTYGSVFPSKMSLPVAEKALPDSSYDYSAKVSPFSKTAPKTHRRTRQYPALLVNER